MLPDTNLTCTTGKGRVIDFAMVNEQAKAMISDVQICGTTPWKTHKGLCFDLQRSAAQLRARVLKRPAKIELAPAEHRADNQQITWQQAKSSVPYQEGCDHTSQKTLAHKKELIAKAPLLPCILPVQQSVENCCRLQSVGAAIDEHVTVDTGIAQGETWRYKG